MAAPAPTLHDATCIHTGCTTTTPFQVFETSGGSTSYTPPSGWAFWMLGSPYRKPNLGVCEQHSTFAAARGDSVFNVSVKNETHGVYYTLHEKSIVLGKVTFASNTMAMQPTPGQVHPRLLVLGRRLATMLNLSPDNGIVDDLMAPGAKPRIVRGGPAGHWSTWTVEVEYTAPDGHRENVFLSYPQLASWRAR